MWVYLCMLAIIRHRAVSTPWDWPAHEAMIISVYGQWTYNQAERLLKEKGR